MIIAYEENKVSFEKVEKKVSKILFLQKILLVDDDRHQLDMLKGMIPDFAKMCESDYSYEVDCAFTIMQARDFVDKNYYDYIVLDGMERGCIDFIIYMQRKHNEMFHNIIAYTGDQYLEREMEELGVRKNSHKDWKEVFQMIGIDMEAWMKKYKQ